MACQTHQWKRTGKEEYKYSWSCGRCAKRVTKKGNDARPASKGCTAQGGPDPGMHHWGDADKTKIYEDKCKVCNETRWHE